MASPSRVLIVTPERAPSTRGNAVTVQRIATSLEERGLAVTVATPGELPPSGARPDVVHAFHARTAGTPARAYAAKVGAPLVITITGTDANVDLAGPERDEVLENLRAAKLIAVFHASMGEAVASADAALAPRIRIIPQAPMLPQTRFDFRSQCGLPRRAVLLLLPGGIRPVKGTLFPFAPFRQARAKHPELHLALVGPRLDPAYAARVDREIAATPGSTYVGELPHERMHAAIVGSDLLLNCSESEGGMANTLLEAMTTDTPVLARRIPGNLSLVRDGVTGMVFGDEAEFLAKLEAFLADRRGALKMAQVAREEVTRTYRRESEAQGYELIYREAMTL